MQWASLDDVLGQRRVLSWGLGMGQRAHVAEAIAGSDGRRALFLPWKGTMYGHILIGLPVVLSERGLAAHQVHGGGQGKLVVHRHVSGKTCKLSCGHDAQL